jgi:phosphocarrier protein HPr
MRNPDERLGMEIQTFTIRNRLGLHARAAALLVKTANRFAAEITIEKDSLEVNGKSIIGILMLAASKGSKITLKVEGKDSLQALQTLGRLIEIKFGEE